MTLGRPFVHPHQGTFGNYGPDAAVPYRVKTRLAVGGLWDWSASPVA